MDREKSLLHFQLGCFNFMASEFSPEKNDCDGNSPDLSPALICNASPNRMDSEQSPGGLEHLGR